MQLTDREWTWLWEYTRTGSNASQAARVAYGGTPISVRVKGHKKKVKLKPILDRVSARWSDLTKEVDQIAYSSESGQSFLVDSGRLFRASPGT